MKRLLSAPFQSITGAALLLGAASFLSRIIGLVRDRILAHQFGAGAELDIYTAAFRVPDFLYNIIIVGALSAGFIPIFLEIFEKEKQKAWEFTNSVLSITFMALGAISVVAFFTLPFFLHFLVPGFSDEAQKQTLMLTRIMLLSPIFLGLSGVVSSVLQSLRSFIVYSFAPLFYNVGIIIGATVFVPFMGIQGLAYGVILGAILHFAVQLPLLFHYGFRFSFHFSTKNKSIKKLFKLMIPRTLTLATVQINVVLTTLLASTLAVGSVTAYNFASNISSLPVGIIGISFALAAFPTLAELAGKGDTVEFEKHLSNTTRQILFFIIPLTILFLLLRAQIIRILLGTGQFDWNDTITTAETVGMLSLSLFAQCLIPLFIRAFYALQNTRTPLLITLISTIFTVLFSFFLKDVYGVAGLALGISLGSILQFAFLWVALQHEMKISSAKKLLLSTFKITVAAVCMGVFTQILKYPVSLFVDMNTFLGIFTQTVITGGVGLAIYFFLCYCLRLPEMMILLQSLQKRWFQLKNVPSEVEQLK